MGIYDHVTYDFSDLFGRNVILRCQHFKSFGIKLKIKYAFIAVYLLSHGLGRIVDIYESEDMRMVTSARKIMLSRYKERFNSFPSLHCIPKRSVQFDSSIFKQFFFKFRHASELP